MFNFDYITKENTKEDRYTILIVGSSGSGKSNAFFVPNRSSARYW